MRHMLSPLFRSPTLNLQIGLASLAIHVLALAPTLYVMLVFSRYLSHGLDATLFSLTVGVLLAMLMETLLKGARYRVAVALCARTDRERIDALSAQAVQARIEALQQLPPEVRAAPQRSLEQLANALTPANLLALVDAPFALVFLLALTLLAWPLGILAALLLGATVLIILLKARRMHQAQKELQQAALAQQEIASSAERWDTVRTVDGGSFLTRWWRSRAGASRVARSQVQQQAESLQQSIQVMTALLTVGVIALAAKLVTNQSLDPGVLFGASLLATRAISLITRPTQNFYTLLQGSQALEQIDRFLQLPAAPKQGSRPGAFGGRIEFKDVAYWHPGTPAPLFENLNLSLPAGGLLVICGGNGAGKTTCARLLAGLLTPVRGSILADGIDLRQLDPDWWRQQLLYLPQEPEFYDASLRENLQARAPQATDEQITEVLRSVGLGAFLDQSQDGLNMPITRGGRTLSLGQRRRLALARALLGDGRLVIVDEPTEALDAAGVATVNNLLNRFIQQGKTVVVVVQQAGGLARHGTVVDLNSKPVPAVFAAKAQASAKPGPQQPAASEAIGSLSL